MVGIPHFTPQNADQFFVFEHPMGFVGVIITIFDKPPNIDGCFQK